MCMAATLSKTQLELMDAYWRASNYLTVGQIYLQENSLLREALRPEHIKPRLLGHWGTSPGQNFIYVHLNRLIKETDANIIYVCGPGHGGPAIVAQTYLEGTYSEVYPHISRDLDGLRRLFFAAAFLDDVHCAGAHGLSEADSATLKEIAAQAAPQAPKP
jgi:xylulose-5-phosphate/fructose-6-phosphate phosphoketolase